MKDEETETRDEAIGELETERENKKKRAGGVEAKEGVGR